MATFDSAAVTMTATRATHLPSALGTLPISQENIYSLLNILQLSEEQFRRTSYDNGQFVSKPLVIVQASNC